MPKDRTADEPQRAPILDAGVNCWKKAAVRRAAFLVDGDSYYRAVADAIDGARRSIWILGWDTDSKIPLRREAGAPGLESFLRTKLEENPELRVHVLSWDFAMVYAFERELAPLFRLSWSSHERLHYHLDGHHPVGACQHQKVVVIDDSVAFAGGFDLTKSRWDTTEHRVDEPGRSTPDGSPYPPFHDVQMAVDGDAARTLGDLARERWHRATGERIEPERDTDSDPWPGGLEADAENAVVGIARTLPPYDSTDPVREVERLHLDAIAAARDSIYIESQYFTSMTIAEALCARLEEAEGPEVVAVVPGECPGWLEETTMGVLRNQCLLRLLNADRYGRFRVYHPVVGDVPIFVHSKVMV
ncbi:MAG: VTT domain-containing protein, partial [Vicinamibacteria bacterium]